LPTARNESGYEEEVALFLKTLGEEDLSKRIVKALIAMNETPRLWIR
jgi:hypothetical protein